MKKIRYQNLSLEYTRISDFGVRYNIEKFTNKLHKFLKNKHKFIINVFRLCLYTKKYRDTINIIHANNNSIYLDGYYRQIEEIFKDTHIKKICNGIYHAIFLSDNGTVFSFGENDTGQLGTHMNICDYPIKISGNKVIKDICCGSSQTFMLTYNGNIYACGENDNNELLLDHSCTIEIPEKITRIKNIKKISANKNGDTIGFLSRENIFYHHYFKSRSGLMKKEDIVRYNIDYHYAIMKDSSNRYYYYMPKINKLCQIKYKNIIDYKCDSLYTLFKFNNNKIRIMNLVGNMKKYILEPNDKIILEDCIDYPIIKSNKHYYHYKINYKIFCSLHINIEKIGIESLLKMCTIFLQCNIEQYKKYIKNLPQDLRKLFGKKN